MSKILVGDHTTITAKDLNAALRKAKGNSKELIEAEIDDGSELVRMSERRSK